METLFYKHYKFNVRVKRRSGCWEGQLMQFPQVKATAGSIKEVLAKLPEVMAKLEDEWLDRQFCFYP